MSKTKGSITEKMVKLDGLLAWFDSDTFKLEEAAARFAEAKLLASEIEQELMEMKNSITVLAEHFDQETQ